MLRVGCNPFATEMTGYSAYNKLENINLEVNIESLLFCFSASASMSNGKATKFEGIRGSTLK